MNYTNKNFVLLLKKILKIRNIFYFFLLKKNFLKPLHFYCITFTVHREYMATNWEKGMGCAAYKFTNNAYK